MKRIAVVEDEVYMREELCNMLQKDGYLAEAITEFDPRPGADFQRSGKG